MIRNPFAKSPLGGPRVPTEAAAPIGTAIYAVGDIHGCVDLLAELHQRIEKDAAQRNAERRVLVYLGDYVDRGADSAAVIDLILDEPPRGFEVVTLMGNHERLMLEFLDNVRHGPLWLRNGGDATLQSYGVAADAAGYLDAKPLLDMQMALIERLPPRHLAFLQGLRLKHAAGDYFFAHAGIRPGVPLDAQAEEDLIWIRDLFLNSKADHGRVVVHGHTIRPEPEFHPNRIGIDTGAYFTGHLTCLALEGTKRRIISTDS